MNTNIEIAQAVDPGKTLSMFLQESIRRIDTDSTLNSNCRENALTFANSALSIFIGFINSMESSPENVAKKCFLTASGSIPTLSSDANEAKFHLYFSEIALQNYFKECQSLDGISIEKMLSDLLNAQNLLKPLVKTEN